MQPSLMPTGTAVDKAVAHNAVAPTGFGIKRDVGVMALTAGATANAAAAVAPAHGKRRNVVRNASPKCVEIGCWTVWARHFK